MLIRKSDRGTAPTLGYGLSVKLTTLIVFVWVTRCEDDGWKNVVFFNFFFSSLCLFVFSVVGKEVNIWSACLELRQRFILVLLVWQVTMSGMKELKSKVQQLERKYLVRVSILSVPSNASQHRRERRDLMREREINMSWLFIREDDFDNLFCCFYGSNPFHRAWVPFRALFWIWPTRGRRQVYPIHWRPSSNVEEIGKRRMNHRIPWIQNLMVESELSSGGGKGNRNGDDDS